MGDLAFRLAVVALAAVVAVVLVRLVRDRGDRPQSIVATGLAPGVYLFSSSSCDECPIARTRLEGVLGRDGYGEIAWEEDPETFDRLGITEVPATLVVADNAAELYPGAPDRLIRSLNP